MTDNKNSIRAIRYAVQLFFLLFTIYMGYRFYLFTLYFLEAGRSFVDRPASVEGFLPIAGLMSLKLFVMTGIVEPAHPAAFVIFGSAFLVSLAAKKGFCGWICPIGTISQYLWMAGEKIFGRNFRIERNTDRVLRSLKYLLMGFFLFMIGLTIGPSMMTLFFMSDYYKAVDVRMLNFFVNMSVLTFWVLIGLVALSLVYKNVWCRYLCPYGALLGLMSIPSLFKVRRNEKQCTHCGTCTRNCPSLIDVEKKEIVSSPECFGCMTCVSRCPSEGALEMTAKLGKTRKTVRPYLYPVVLLVVFYLVIGIGMVGGKWQSKVPHQEYQRLVPEIFRK